MGVQSLSLCLPDESLELFRGCECAQEREMSFAFWQSIALAVSGPALR